MRKTTRREILKTGLYGVSAVALGPYTRILGSNDDIGVAVIGFRSRGAALLGAFEKIDGVRITALCDADEQVLQREAAKRPGVFATTDMRRVMDRDDVDVVVSATPNHWHALLTVWACQAGKDVYIEKPVSHGIWEGRKMVEAARKYDRIVAAGFQNRSEPGLRDFYQYLHEGNIGKVLAVRGLCYRNRSGIGKRAEPLPPPESVDYDLWLGPAEDLPMMRNQFHYDWHWVWNTGNGDVGNQGPHELDLMRWALDDPSHPETVRSSGGRFEWDDAGETPNTLVTEFDFNGTRTIFEVNDIVRDGQSKAFKGIGVGVVITCEGGEFRGGRGGGKIYDADGKVMKEFAGGGGRHQDNFIEAVRARDRKILNAEIESAHVSSSLAHLANISYRAGTLSRLPIVNDLGPDAVISYQRRLEDGGLDSKESWTIGPRLEFDRETEQFQDGSSSLGNSLLKRKYREPFVVPENV